MNGELDYVTDGKYAYVLGYGPMSHATAKALVSAINGLTRVVHDDLSDVEGGNFGNVHVALRLERVATLSCDRCGAAMDAINAANAKRFISKHERCAV